MSVKLDVIKLDINQIQKILPHRYPFLFIDQVLECQPLVSAHATKNVTMNEWFFAGHFPQEPVMPGVLIVEALAQLAGIVMLANSVNIIAEPEKEPKSIYFVKIENATFSQKVVPGHTLHLYANVTRTLGKMNFFDVSAKIDVDGDMKVVTSAKIVATAG